MEDPLRLGDKPTATSVQIARSAPHPEVHRICSRIVNNQHSDSVDVRVQMLAHALYFAYMDIKEALARE